MNKILKYLQWLPFAISLGALIIYIVYTIQIKMNPAIIVTDKLINTLKTYLIIALICLFIGLLIILIKKIYKLMREEEYVKEEKVITKTITTPVKEETKITQTVITPEEEKVVTHIKEEKVVIPDAKKEEVIKVVEEKIKEEPIEKEYTYKVESVVCPECGKPLSKDAAICPHCGILFDDEILRILDKYDKKRYKVKINPISTIVNIIITILFIILIFLICNMLYNRYNENIKNITSIVQRR